MPITLAEAEHAAAGVGTTRRTGDARVVDATHDSRQVEPGSLYCTIPGETVDGHRFAGEALERGASALLVERPLDVDGPQLEVASVRRALGPVAAAVHGRPSERLIVVGVTGTNGKTTTAYLLEAALGAGGIGTGVIGTIETRIHGIAQPGVRTTPEATDLQRLLARMEVRGVGAVAMEVSSHGLDQHRVDGTAFDVAVFTNLSQDHLDYHGTLERYFAAKARFFDGELAARGVVCTDDEWGRRIAEESAVPVTTYGRRVDADARVVDITTTLEGTRCRIVMVDQEIDLRTRLVGSHNALNAAAAWLAATRAGVDPAAARTGIDACRGVPGRLEPVDLGQPFAVLVDYAHTPDALDNAIRVCRDLASDGGRIHVVVGCGGDRDRVKRPAMGRIAAGADHAVLTSDNPRSEDPEDILQEVVAGAHQVSGGQVDAVVDRREAIRRAVSAAVAGDVVLIAGKGHETGQEFADHTIPFDDREVAAEALTDAGWDAPTDRRVAS
ncbi:MAG: UDP-N-acetylmuramoyl-L-alanyl-D-glutamate--2,6-diaminopimelate ligase [Actinobacteria bacterium]|nr:UDP-N-acetylmuramoyl-L-alanyl-D-glutamate--2,6-diaminopimelate ligase [Actinomycetota bacterium]